MKSYRVPLALLVIVLAVLGALLHPLALAHVHAPYPVPRVDKA